MIANKLFQGLVLIRYMATKPNVSRNVLYVLYCIAELRVQPTIRLNRKRKNAVVVDSDFLSDINNDDDA